MFTNIAALISYPGDITATFGILAALTIATATLPLRTGDGQHGSAGPGAVDVWQLRETIHNATHPHAPPEPDDDIFWPEEDWSGPPEATRRLPIPQPLGPEPHHQKNNYIGRHRLIEADRYGLPPGIDLRINPDIAHRAAA